MLRFRTALMLAATVFATSTMPAAAEPQTLMDALAGRESPPCPRYQRTPRDFCNIVVLRPGGNPTQDMTGSIGHAKSWGGNGGPRCKVICRFPRNTP